MKTSMLSSMVFAIAVNAPATAQDLNARQTDGAANRIVVAEALRNIPLQINAAACFLSNGIAAERAREVLMSGIEDYDIYADALLHGSDTLGIPSEEKWRKTIVEIEALLSGWAQIRGAALRLLDDPEDTVAAGLIYNSMAALLEQSDIFVAHIEGEYARPTEILFADLLALEVVGRMAGLSQKIAYGVCSLSVDDRNDLQVANIVADRQTFELSLRALLDGMLELGIRAAPTNEIRSALDTIESHLLVIKPRIANVTDLTPIELGDLYHELLSIQAEIDDLEAHYLTYSKRVII